MSKKKKIMCPTCQIPMKDVRARMFNGDYECEICGQTWNEEGGLNIYRNHPGKPDSSTQKDKNETI